MSQSEIISYEPATGAELWRGKPGNIDDLVARARKAWPEWAAQPLTVRMEMMRRFANEVRKDSEKLATTLARETGRPMWEATEEVESVIARVEISVNAYAERTAQRRLNTALQGNTSVRHKPHGVMGVIGSFSSPAQMPCNHIIPALIAGNVVVFKPSEKAPASAEILVRCFHQAGISTSIVQLAVGGPAEGQELVAHEGIDGIAFTGSAHVGISINRKLAARPDKIVSLQLGGNNPLVVWDTPLIAEAAAIVIQSAFTSTGQRCTSARRLIVSAGIYDALIGEVKKLADRLIVGAPFDQPPPFMGPVIDNSVADGLTESFLYFLSNGGKAIKHLVRPDEKLPFLSPGIVDVTTMEARPDVELFGPILQVVKAENLDEAIREANNTRFGLVAALVGGTPQDYNRFWANVRAGVVNWNRPTTTISQAGPVGGIGLSGNHRPSAYYAADYCAYPVASAELEQPRAAVGIGLRDSEG